MRVGRDRDGSGHQKKLKEAQIRANEAKVTDNREKKAKRGEKKDKETRAIMETVKDLILTETEINERLTNDELTRQLNCHREIEVRRIKVKLTVGGNSSPQVSAENSEDQVPKKTFFKLKVTRIDELKKAVARFHARGETRESAGQLLSGGGAGDVEMHIDTEGDTLYVADNDDL